MRLELALRVETLQAAGADQPDLGGTAPSVDSRLQQTSMRPQQRDATSALDRLRTLVALQVDVEVLLLEEAALTDRTLEVTFAPVQT